MNIMDICGAYIMIYYPMDPLNPNCIYIQLQGFPVPLKQILGVMPRLELLGESNPSGKRCLSLRIITSNMLEWFFSGQSLVVKKKTLLLVMVTFASMDIYGKKTRGLYKLKLPIQDWGWNCYRLKKEKHSRHWCGRLLFIVRDWVPSESPNFIVLPASQNWRENKQETTHFLIETCWQFHHVSSKPMKIKKPGPSIWKCMLVKTNDRIIPQKKPATSVVTPIILGCHSRRH